jgi:hypothetical protein
MSNNAIYVLYRQGCLCYNMQAETGAVSNSDEKLN